MAVTWVIIVATLGLLLIPITVAAVAGFLVARKQSQSNSQNYFWDDD